MIRCKVSCSLDLASSGIRLSLVCRSSLTNSWKDFPKYVGLPDRLGISLEFLKKVSDHLLALLFIAYDGGDFCLNIRPNHMDRRR